MLEAVRRFFEERLMTGSETAETSGRRLQLATAALLMEVARADQGVQEQEIIAVERAIGKTFQLPKSEVDELVQLAKKEAREATSDYAFTSLINKGFEYAEKVALVEMLWEVAYADGELDKYEEHLIRRVAELIYVPHQEFIAAKLRVAAKVR